MDLTIYLCTFLYDRHVVKNFLSALGLFFRATFLFHPHPTTLNPLHFPQQKRLKISISKESPPLLPPANSQLWWGARGGTSMAPEKVLGEWHFRAGVGGVSASCSVFRYGFYWFKFHWMTSIQCFRINWALCYGRINDIMIINMCIPRVTKLTVVQQVYISDFHCLLLRNKWTWTQPQARCI